MLHHTSIPWSPESMRRRIFSLTCSSGNAMSVLKPTSFGMAFLQKRVLELMYSGFAAFFFRTGTASHSRRERSTYAWRDMTPSVSLRFGVGT